jgi:hypothetical protein
LAQRIADLSLAVAQAAAAAALPVMQAVEVAALVEQELVHRLKILQVGPEPPDKEILAATEGTAPAIQQQ